MSTQTACSNLGPRLDIILSFQISILFVVYCWPDSQIIDPQFWLSQLLMQVSVPLFSGQCFLFPWFDLNLCQVDWHYNFYSMLLY